MFPGKSSKGLGQRNGERKEAEQGQTPSKVLWRISRPPPPWAPSHGSSEDSAPLLRVVPVGGKELEVLYPHPCQPSVQGPSHPRCQQEGVSRSPGWASDTELQVLAPGRESAREPGVVCALTVKGCEGLWVEYGLQKLNKKLQKITGEANTALNKPYSSVG